jgi:hypothetical protein
MIIRLFRDNQIFVVFVCFLISVFLWIISGFNSVFDHSSVTSNYSPVFQVFPILKEIDTYQAVAAFLNALMLYLSSFYISGIVVRYQIIPRRTALPMFIFMILSLPYFISYTGFSYPLLTFIILLTILDLIFSSIDTKKTNFRFFDSALMLSAASLVNAYFIYLAIFLVFVWVQFRGGKWREILFLLFGLLIPYMFYSAILYIINKDFLSTFYAFTHFKELTFNLSIPKAYYYLGVFLAILLVIGSVHIIKNYGKMKIITRKYSLIFLSLFATILLTLFIFRAIGIDFIFYLVFPISFLFSYYFSTCRTNFLNQVLFVVFIASNILIVLIN